MKSKSNMERATSHHENFWWFAVLSILALLLAMWIDTEKFTDWRDAFTPLPLVCVIFTFSYAARTFRAFKREIADLKSGDPDDSTATQDAE